jgi:acyl-CoA synthetase (AMP-forming)/AMP-acid ligase II
MRKNGPVTSPEQMLDRIIDFDFVFLALAPMMHAAAQWVSLLWLFCGAKVVLYNGAFDPVRVWQMIEDEKVSAVTVVGDAMGRPLADAFDEFGPFDTSSLFALSNGGAPLTAGTRKRLMAAAPSAVFTDGFGSSETGIQGSQRVEAGQDAKEVRFDNVAEGTKVLDDNWNEITPGSGVIGRVAHGGHIPLRYHNAPEKTAENFREIDGTRYVLSGDMATVEADGSVQLIGRGSVCINTGGEKVYPEEVESALKAHPSVYDVVVVGVDDARWGESVAAVVQPAKDASPTLDDLAEHCRTTLAGYKVPRSLVIVDEVVRSPAGKADYRWAKKTAAS